MRTKSSRVRVTQTYVKLTQVLICGASFLEATSRGASVTTAQDMAPGACTLGSFLLGVSLAA